MQLEQIVSQIEKITKLKTEVITISKEDFVYKVSKWYLSQYPNYQEKIIVLKTETNMNLFEKNLLCFTQNGFDWELARAYYLEPFLVKIMEKVMKMKNY